MCRKPDSLGSAGAVSRSAMPANRQPILLESKVMAKHSSQILDLARKGAEHKYEELKAEIAALVKAFPHVASKPSAPRKLARVRSRRRGNVNAEPAPKRRKMSAKARKAISQAQKKRWAKQKAGEKK